MAAPGSKPPVPGVPHQPTAAAEHPPQEVSPTADTRPAGAEPAGAEPSAALEATVKGTYVGGAATGTTLVPVNSDGSSANTATTAARHSVTSPETRYHDIGFIGAGGMGEVRRVYDHVLGRTLAMKVLSASLSEDVQARSRFFNEARITGSLQHPGIVAVHDVGELADGRPFFTMKEVRGRTFGIQIAQLQHVRDDNGGARSLVLRRIVSALVRACEALAYAHSANIIHRDIKPDNLMVGRFGEVQVMDWGLAAKLPDSSDGGTAGSLADTDEVLLSMALPGDTLRSLASDDDRVAGTLVYMPPEQARGDSEAMCRASDVYSLGAVLYKVLAGKAPYAGEGNVWAALLNGPPEPIAGAGAIGPAALRRICEVAMAREPSDRYPDAGEMARALQNWLDDTQRRERADALVAEADKIWQGSDDEPGIAMLRDEIARLRQDAGVMLDGIKPSDPVRKKIPAWSLQDQADTLEHRSAVRVVEWQQVLRSALNEVPDLLAAHTRLADHYQRVLGDAEQRRSANDIKRAEALLRVHDRGSHTAYLRGDASLSLVTDPPGASVTLLRYEVTNRRLVSQYVRELGTTPLLDVSLAAGSYLLLIKSRGYHDVRYPVLLPRGGAWHGLRPGTATPQPVQLFEKGRLGHDDVYIPAGWFLSGGDAHALESLPLRRVWVEDLVMKRYPVTRGEYRTFLNTLVDDGCPDAALMHVPKRPLGHTSAGEPLPAWPRDADGRFQLPTEWPEEAQVRWPVTRINWHDACAYAAWLTARQGVAWRLPCELEWEKAARGVDGRLFPWGDFFDPTFACVLESHDEPLSPRPVEEYPDDESPYGIRGTAGNVRDWCIDRWQRTGPNVVDERLVWQPPEDRAGETNLRCVRGGAWTAPGSRGRPASRYADKPTLVWGGLGVRLVRDLTRLHGVS